MKNERVRKPLAEKDREFGIVAEDEGSPSHAGFANSPRDALAVGLVPGVLPFPKPLLPRDELPGDTITAKVRVVHKNGVIADVLPMG
jgi:hypothetical protein